jgi:NSS family neurotransmitter:Na+ symporter
MSNLSKNIHGQWSTRFAFILAVSGSAVGLGNIWKFPYIAGMNGGGAFVLVYLLCILAIGMPILMSEILLGRMGQKNPIQTMRELGTAHAGNSSWSIIGSLGVFTGALILSYYSVIAGWAMNYAFLAINGSLSQVSVELAPAIFDGVVGSPLNVLFWHTLFMILTAYVVSKGLIRGIERSIRVLMPLLVVLLLTLFIFSVINGDAAAAFIFLFKFDFEALTSEGVLVALGHAFFTLSLGMGAVMAYGAYLPKDYSLSRIAASIVFTDTAIALIAGIIIFSVVFANGLDAGQGPGLIFQTLPVAFSSLPFPSVIAFLFFILLVAAAWTSSISLIEPGVAWMIEAFDWSRMRSTCVIAFSVWSIGLLSVFSFNSLSGFTFWHGTWFDNFDFLTANLLLPFGGLLISIFAGWKLSSAISQVEINTSYLSGFKVWRFLSRYVAPVGIAIIFLDGLGVI